MPVLHIVAIGPAGSGKSTIVRHLAKNPPEGYKLKQQNAESPQAYGQEYWCLTFEKAKQRKAKR